MGLLWLFTVFLGIIIIAVFWFMRIFQKCKVIESVSIQQKINFIKKISPLCHTKGWSIYGVDNGLRIWQKDVGSVISHWYTGNVIYGCSCVVSASLKDILNAIQDLRYIAEWDPCVQGISRISTGTGHDVISGTPVSMATIDHVTLRFLKMLGRNTKTIYSRYWYSNADKEGWFFSSAMQKSPLTSGFSWSAVVIKPIVTEINAKPSHFKMGLITAPSVNYTPMCDIKLFTSVRLAGLRDFLTFSYSGKMVNNQSGVTPNGNVIKDSTEKNEVNASIEKMTEEEPEEISFNEDESKIPIPEGKDKTSLEDNIKQMQKLCMQAYNAAVGGDGWSFLANVKNVEITKRSAQSGEPPWDTLKGTVRVNVPAHYALAYGFDLEYRGEWDDLYARGETVKEFNPLTKIFRTEFKAIWPTSGRDFTNLVALREVEDGLYCIAGASAGECPECPPKRGLVRGDLLVMGFFVKEISSDPPCCQITYISRADLKGNLPPRLVNRVTQSQPQGLAVLRDRLEVLYNQDKEQGADSDQMSDIQQRGVEIWTELMKIRELKESGLLDVPVVKTLKESPGSSRKRFHKFKQDSLDSSQSTADEKSLIEDSLIKDEKMESALEKSGLEVSDENMELPFVGTSQVDYKTLGNQAAATVLGEVVLASKAEIGSDNLNDPTKNKGEWTYQSIEKDVVILRKISPGEKIHSFLGKGLIKCSPTVVFDAVKNHMTRHVYDKMLKKTKLIREIDEHTKLQYLHFEAAQCFLKQARDFLVLTVDRVEPERFAVAGVSVDSPECPPLKNMVRGKVYGSGFVIEPVRQDGRLYSMVSYLSQVDFGGMIPVRLLNYVARRQPLCIAYLREYLEKFKE